MLGIAWKRWNWNDDGLIPLATILMTAAWGYPLFSAFLRDPKTGVPNPGFTFWLTAIVLVGGFLAGRLASQNRMGAVIVVVGGMAMILVSLLLTVPSEGKALDLWFIDMFKFVERGEQTGEVLPTPLVMIVFTTLLWSRGVRMASMRHEGAVGAFTVGIVAIAGLLLVSAILPSTGEAASASGSGFLQTALSGLAPLFLVAVPAAILFSLLAPALGGWAHTAGEISLVAGVLFLNLIMPFGPSTKGLLGWLLLFVSSGLATLALMSVSTTLQEQERLTGIHLQIDRYWVMIMLVVIVSVLLAGLLVGQIVAPGAVLRMLGLLRPIWFFVRQVLLFLILIFAYLFFSLIEPLLAEIQQRPAREPRTLFSPMEQESMEEFAREAVEIPPAFTVLLQIVLILGFLSVIALIFYLAIRQREGRVLEQGEIVETRETILSMDLIQEQLKNLLAGFGQRRKQSFFVDLGPPGDRRRIVREMYQQVLSEAIRLDAPRRKQQTPRTYEPTLVDLCPAEMPSVDVLTQVYMIARYSVEPPTADQVEDARKAFDKVNVALQRKLKLLAESTAWEG
jgi:hypothetical protein